MVVVLVEPPLVVMGRKHFQGTGRVREGVLRYEHGGEARKVVFR